MKLLEYLRIRHPKVNALTKVEAGILGINYPLESGWVELYTDDIPYETVCELLRKRAERYETESYKASKTKSKNKGVKKFKYSKKKQVQGVAGSRTQQFWYSK